MKVKITEMSKNLLNFSLLCYVSVLNPPPLIPPPPPPPPPSSRVRLELQRLQRSSADRLPAVHGGLRAAGRGVRAGLLPRVLWGGGQMSRSVQHQADRSGSHSSCVLVICFWLKPFISRVPEERVYGSANGDDGSGNVAQIILGGRRGNKRFEAKIMPFLRLTRTFRTPETSSKKKTYVEEKSFGSLWK